MSDEPVNIFCIGQDKPGSVRHNTPTFTCFDRYFLPECLDDISGTLLVRLACRIKRNTASGQVDEPTHCRITNPLNAVCDQTVRRQTARVASGGITKLSNDQRMSQPVAKLGNIRNEELNRSLSEY